MTSLRLKDLNGPMVPRLSNERAARLPRAALCFLMRSFSVYAVTTTTTSLRALSPPLFTAEMDTST